MKDIIKIITFNVRFFHTAFIFISIFISSSINFSQEYIKELPKEKNQLFWLLKVKVETIQEENFRVNDSTNRLKNITKNYYDSNGYLIKREIFDSLYTVLSQVREYKYDAKGNYTDFFLNGKLRERREYNDSGKIMLRYYYDYSEISDTHFHRYDIYGNEVEILIEYSSGKIDTFLITHYNYDFSVNPPKIISDSSFYYEHNYRELIISELDPYGRCARSITIRPNSERNDTTLFYYNDKNLFDSTISYSNKGTRKYIREYDNNYRLTKTIHYTNTNSKPSKYYLSYNDTIYMKIDSLFKSNGLDLLKSSDFEKIGVIFKSLYNGENEIRFQITSQYYSNGLIKNLIRNDFNENKINAIEKKFYEYEFY